MVRQSYTLQSFPSYFQHSLGTIHSHYNIIDYIPYVVLCFSWLFCNYQPVLLNPFPFSPSHPNPSPLKIISLFSVSICFLLCLFILFFKFHMYNTKGRALSQSRLKDLTSFTNWILITPFIHSKKGQRTENGKSNENAAILAKLFCKVDSTIAVGLCGDFPSIKNNFSRSTVVTVVATVLQHGTAVTQWECIKIITSTYLSLTWGQLD